MNLQTSNRIVNLMFTFSILLGAISSLNGQIFTLGSGVSDIDGNTYQTIVINGQEWMAENLKTSRYANGNTIPSDLNNFQDEYQIDSLNVGSWLNYNNDSQLGNIYGKLYNWYAVTDSRSLCPTGWKVPNEADWNTLIDFLDPGNNHFSEASQSHFAGGMMKSVGTQFWLNPNEGATNESGFTGLPAGNYMFSDFNELGQNGSWWSLNQRDWFEGWMRGVAFSTDNLARYAHGKSRGLSVRCVKTNVSGIDEIKLNNRTLIKITDIIGRETIIKSNEVLMFYYSDGSIERRFIIQ